MLNLDFLSLPLLTASVLFFASLLVGVFSKRAGFSFLLAFLFTGIMAGEDGPFGVRFNDYRLSFWVGNIALAIILLDGGLRTSFTTFRTGLKPALLLATVGVALTSGFTALAARVFLDLSWPTAFLLGAIVGSTDAAAVFSLLKSAGVRLNERVATTLEIESGMNDPMAVFLTLTFIGVASAGGLAGLGDTHTEQVLDVITSLGSQFGWGTVLGIGAGLGFAWGLGRLGLLTEAPDGVLALLVASAGLVVFAFVTWFGGSGFLAVYLFGIALNKKIGPQLESSLSALDGYAWLSQASMFLLLGLLVTPSSMLETFWPALAVALAMMFVARPLAVWLCLGPMGFTREEVAYIGWVGLRGAVPIVLAIFPFMAGVPDAHLIFNVAFLVVLASLILQGASIGWFARRMDVALPDDANESAMRLVFGDFNLTGETIVADVCLFYGLREPDDAHLPLGNWMARSFKRPLVVGDHVMLDGAELSVRSMDGGRVQSVGLRLPDSPAESQA
ncbi:potassium/proton antiporter [Aquabacterium sp. A3]|uniref:potassium/proton antiporter n=1 Tax=Aquabacterium sp. A3 TaxID=3132829 RepID=UPI003119563F